jgi:hypothetical protein
MSAIQDRLQMHIAALKAREKVAKKSKGAVVAQPLNVSSPEDHLTRRHYVDRYMCDATRAQTPPIEPAPAAPFSFRLILPLACFCHTTPCRSHELAVGRTAFDVDPTADPFQPSPRPAAAADPALKRAAGVRVGHGHLADCSESMQDLARWVAE